MGGLTARAYPVCNYAVMYFQDLTFYQHFEFDSSALNVGWLDSAHPFPTGDVPIDFIEKLKRLAREPVLFTCGQHVCEFCDLGPRPVGLDMAAYKARHERATAADALSSAEIRVVDRDGKVYASPAMIGHYVATHRYQPPREFVEAVMEMLPLPFQYSQPPYGQNAHAASR